MKDYSGSAILGFLLSSTLGWGDIGVAFLLGGVGAIGGVLFKAGIDWAIYKWKNRKKGVSK